MRKPRPRRVVEQVVPKDALARIVAEVIDQRELTQARAAAVMDEAQSQISLVASGRTRGFSADRLFRMLVRLGVSVDIVVRNGAKRRLGKVRVVKWDV